MRIIRGLSAALLMAAIPALAAAPAMAAPEGQMTWAVHFALAPTYEDVKLKSK